MDNLWTRRTTSNGKLSLSTSSNGINGSPDPSGRNAPSFPKRVGEGTGFGKSANSATTPGTGSALHSPGAAAFGLGSGAFASFGSAKTPKTMGNPFDLAMGQVGAKGVGASSGAGGEKGAKEKVVTKAPSMAAISELNASESGSVPHPLRHQWVFWCRPPVSKGQGGFVDYEKTIRAMCRCSTVEDFITVYKHLRHPSALPTMSEYHFFKSGIRPIWEDEINKKGGKWVVRIKKGVADRYWEDLLFALIGDQFGDTGDEVCGAVISVRNGEDMISIWTRNDGGRVLKIRETMKQVLKFPPNTRIEFKSHDSALQQRAAVEESRQKNHHHHHRDDKRPQNQTPSKAPTDDQKGS